MKSLHIALIILLVMSSHSYGNPESDLFNLCMSQDPAPEMIQEIISHSADINAKESSFFGQTPLMFAVSSVRNPEFVNMLIKFGADINARDEKEMTPLMHAAFNNQNPEILKALLTAGASVNDRDESGRTALTFSVMGTGLLEPEILVTLINASADVNISDDFGTSILMEAARTMTIYESYDERIINPKIFKILLKAGAKIDSQTRTGLTVFDFADNDNVRKALYDAMIQ